jgi:hypothetical protein
MNTTTTTTTADTRVPAPREGYYLMRHTVGRAYARTGNAHNPTERIMWSTHRDDGTLIGSSSSKRSAIELIDYDDDAR